MNIKEPLKAGLIGGLVSGIISAGLNYFIIPFPTTIMGNVISHSMGGFFCSLFAGFISVFLYMTHHKKEPELNN